MRSTWISSRRASTTSTMTWMVRASDIPDGTDDTGCLRASSKHASYHTVARGVIGVEMDCGRLESGACVGGMHLSLGKYISGPSLFEGHRRCEEM